MTDQQQITQGVSELALTRRGFLISMFAAGTAFGFPRSPLAAIDPASPDLSPIDAVGQVFEPTVWYWIDSKNQINVYINRAEMGQHIGTSIARILADELSVEWKNVHITHVDNKKKWTGGPTAGSTSISRSWPVYRQAGAAGRIALIEAAAQQWDLDPSECKASNGQVTGGGNTISYGELVAAGLTRSFSEDELKSLPLKPHSEFQLIGKEVTALDILNKTNGKAIYGIDARVEGMVYGVPLIPPTRSGSSVLSIDDSDAKNQAGYLRTVDLDDPSGIVPGMVVVLGKTLMAAKWASARVKVVWKPGETAEVSEADIQDLSRKLIEDESVGGILDTGNYDTGPAFTAAADSLEAEYTTQTVLHFTMEPMNATAFQNDAGQWEIHAGSQWLGLMEAWVQKALNVDADKVVMRTQLLGGGFGRRVYGDYVVAAALTSKAMEGAPVKLVFFREDDILIDCPRSPSVQKLRMAFDADQKPVAMEHSAAAGWPGRTVRPDSSLNEGVNGQRYDPTAIYGADHWYDVGAHKVRAISNDLASQTVRTGFLRSTGPGWTSFAVESFMDEAAHKLGADPVAFRLQHLVAAGKNAGSSPNSVGGAQRQAIVLKRVADLAGYGTGDLGPDTAIGIASTFGMERDMPTWTGTAVKLHVDRTTGKVDVQKLWLVIDCGTLIDPNGAHGQCEGAALWGLSMALHEGSQIENGQVRDHNLNTYLPLRMADTPDIDIEFIKSTEAPVGLGEPGVTGVAPAIGNAIFNAVGVRMRHLPIVPDAVLEALQST